MVRWTIEAKKTALLLIDLSNEFLAPGSPMEIPEGREMIPHLNRLAAACRAKGIPVIYTTHVHRPDGSDLGRMADIFRNVREGRLLREGTEGVEIYPDIRPQPGDILVRKRRYNAFENSDLELILRSKGIDTLIIGGVATNVCCESTARQAFFMDFKVIFLSDGTATFDLPDRGWGPVPRQEAQRYTLTTIAWGFGQVCSIEEVLSQLAEL
jgi:ureidoacrylate peracid hydrolase